MNGEEIVADRGFMQRWQTHSQDCVSQAVFGEVKLDTAPSLAKLSGPTAWRGKPMRGKRSSDGKGTTTIKNLECETLCADYIVCFQSRGCYFHCVSWSQGYFHSQWPPEIVASRHHFGFPWRQTPATQSNVIWRTWETRSVYLRQIQIQ